MSKFRTREDLFLDTLIYLFLIFLTFITIYPFLNVLAISLNDAIDSNRGLLGIWPRKFTLYNFQNILSDHQIYHATMISILRTVIGTVLGLTASTVFAYVLSRKDFFLRKFLTAFVLITMYLNAGILPIFFLYRELNLINNFLVYVIPGMVTAFNVIVIKKFIEQLPDSLVESARIDGAGELRILVQIIVPLSLPILATIALFIAVYQWNAWFDTFLYASSRESLSTLQYELMKTLQSAMRNMGSSSVDYVQSATSQMTTPQSVRAAMTIIATAPILVVYPFLQKYFVKGLTLGGVKE